MTALHDRAAAALDGAAGAAVILSENPLHDSGGGQRSAQIARELLARRLAVLFVARGWVTETVSVDAGTEHPRLVEVPLASAVTDDGIAAIRALCSTRPSLVLTQPPVRAWRVALEAARGAGAVTVYDCMDPWAAEMGRGWYDADVERSIARESDVVVASAPRLVEHTERLTGRPSHLLPNAFDDKIFRAGATWARPADLPEASRVALFVGALWGGWFDWPLARAVVEACTGTTFVFVGDHRGEGRRLPERCVFLGLKAQRALPPYLAHADVAFLPWRVTDASSSMSPLTVYEHLGMGLPVVATPVETVGGMPGVTIASGRSEFIEALQERDRASLDPRTRAEMSAFASESTFSRRVDRLLQLVEAARRPGVRGGGRAPAVHTRLSVSVVMPSYRHEAYVGEAIDSVRGQSLPAGELVVVDDGSSDGSLDVIRRHAFPGTRVLAQANAGAHRALNRAIALSGGDYVAVLNSDDAFEPERLEHAWAVARERGAALLFGSVRLVDGGGAPLSDRHETAVWYRTAREAAASASTLRAGLTHHNVAVTTSNFFFHVELWRRLGGFRPYRYVHDYDFLLRALALCPDRVVFAEELTDVRYRVHASNTIAEDVERAFAERRRMGTRHGGVLGRLLGRVRGRAARRALETVIDASPGYAPVCPPGPRPGEAAPVARSRPTPIRVGLVAPSLHRGGLEEVVALLAEALTRRGAHVDVLCTDSGGEIADRLASCGASVTVADGRSAAIAAWVEETRPDVVSTHFVSRPHIESLVRSGVPVVETVHNCYAWFGPDEWREEALKHEHVAAAIAVSDRVRTYQQERCRCAEPMHVVPNAVHPGRAASAPRAYARRLVGVEEDVPLFLHLGRLARQKNVVGLLDGFSDALDRVPELRLLLVGAEAERGMVAELRARHRALFASGAVRHLPPRRDVGVLLSSADAVVSDSYFEGWSLSASEALWVGTPVVLSECGGAAELVGPDGARGVLLPNPLGDPSLAGPETLLAPPPEAAHANRAALATALVGVARASAEWRARAPELKAWARGRLTPSRMADQYLSILGSVARG